MRDPIQVNLWHSGNIVKFGYCPNLAMNIRWLDIALAISPVTDSLALFPCLWLARNEGVDP